MLVEEERKVRGRKSDEDKKRRNRGRMKRGNEDEKEEEEEEEEEEEKEPEVTEMARPGGTPRSDLFYLEGQEASSSQIKH